jgi:hypothetical protein
MGDRGHITIQGQHMDTPVVLYAHWEANTLPRTLANALAREERWHDPEYLARIIFDELVGSDTSATGYGLGTSVHGDAWRVIDVDTEENTVSFRSETGYATDKYGGETYSFDGFIENFA